MTALTLAPESNPVMHQADRAAAWLPVVRRRLGDPELRRMVSRTPSVALPGERPQQTDGVRHE
jgi:hypothetical protein